MYFPVLCLSILLASVASEDESLVKLGDFENHAHGISGKVFVKDEKTLIIKGKIFKYIFLPHCMFFLHAVNNIRLQPKPSLKIRTANAIYWICLGGTA